MVDYVAPVTFSDQAMLTGSDLDTTVDYIIDALNEPIADASIEVSKLATPYQRRTLQLRWLSTATFPIATTVLDSIALPSLSTDAGEVWYLENADWFCSDVGTGAGKIKINFVTIAAGAVTDTTPVCTITLAKQDGAANDTPSCGRSFVGYALGTPDDIPIILQMTVDTQGSGVLSTAGDILSVVLTLRRELSGA